MRWIDDVSRRNSLRGYESVPSRKVLPFEEVPPSSTPRTINNLTIETGQLPQIRRLPKEDAEQQPYRDEQSPPSNGHDTTNSAEKRSKLYRFFEPKGCLKERDDYSLFLFPPNNRYLFNPNPSKYF